MIRLLLVLFAILPAFALAESRPLPPISAASAIVVDGDTGQVLGEKNADEKRPVASTQKLLTTLIVIERGDLDGRVIVEKSDTLVEPTRLNLKEGDSYRRYDLVEALLIKSANDLAHCVARDYAGSEEAFAEVMTQRAKLLGMENSVFKTASGLPASDQYSTARDMAKLSRAAHANPIIREITGCKSLEFHFADGSTRTLPNTNKLLKTFPHCNGMKTGYTHAARRCLVSSATKNGRTVISVVLGCPPSNIWSDSTALLNFGLDKVTGPAPNS